MCFHKKIKVHNRFRERERPDKINKKFGCQLCGYIVLSIKNTCPHKFCDFCIDSKIISVNALNNCIICEELILHAIYLKFPV